MKRYRYGQNFQTHTNGDMNELTWLGSMEVAPGESLNGRFSTEVWTDTTLRPIMNRAYWDTYCFYVPFRLLWSDWPEFIAEKGTALSPPVTTAPLPVFMETPILANPPVNCVAWNRYAYNLIWNKFFKDVGQAEVVLSSATVKTVTKRPTTFQESSVDPADTVSTIVPGFSTVDETRELFAKDRWNKVREYYGSGYHEYLAALGVKTGWAITEEPELLGKKAADLNYHTVVSTAATGTGDPAGYWKGKNVTTIRNSFFPEHGIIVMLGVSQLEAANRLGSATPLLAKNTQEQYYSPEFEMQAQQDYLASLWGQAQVASTGRMPPFQEYRKPSNQVGGKTNSQDLATLYYYAYSDNTLTPEDFKRPTISGTPGGLFAGNMGAPTPVDFCVSNEVRAIKRSPIKPPASVRGVA